MAILVGRLWGVLLFGAAVCFSSTIFVGTVQGATFKVPTANTAATNDAPNHFVYDPDTGVLYVHQAGEGSVRLRAIRSLGKIPGLSRSQIEILASDNVRAATTRPTATVIRHGEWISVIDPIADRALALNIGPFSSWRKGARFNSIVHRPDGSVIALFGAKARMVDSPSADGSKVLAVIDTRNATVGWLPVRGDLAPSGVTYQYQQTPASEGVAGIDYIAVTASFHQLKPDPSNHKKKKQVYEDGKIYLVLEWGLAYLEEGVGLVTSDRVPALKAGASSPQVLMNGMHESTVVPVKLFSNQVTPEELVAMGSPADPKAFVAAQAVARKQIELARGFEQRIRDGMKGLYGQEEAVDFFVKLAQNQSESETFATVALLGPTGVGKTYGFQMFVKAYLEASGQKSEDPVFVIDMNELPEPRYIESILFGSKPPYIGSDKPSNFVLWLLNHPDGGGILLDELEKAPPEALDTLMSFIGKGAVRLTPTLVESLCKHYKDVPVEEWPAPLREATGDGANPVTELVIKMGKYHVIGLGSNVGSENFGIGRGKVVNSAEEIAMANKRFSSELAKKELRARKYKEEVLNRINWFVPFKMLNQEAHSRITADRIASIEKRYRSKLINFSFSDEARRFLETETYDPRSGAHRVKSQLEQWLSQNFNDAIITKGLINPGDTVLVDVVRGNGTRTASVMRLSREGAPIATLGEYVIGRPLPPNPEFLLERAEGLKAGLEKLIIGHREEIQLVADAIIGQLKETIEDPTRRGLPVVVFVDSSPGTGKTELAKGVAQVLFGDVRRMTRINFNEVIDPRSFASHVTTQMENSLKTSPEAVVELWDELPRMGDGTGFRGIFENVLMGNLDENILPSLDKSAGDTHMQPFRIILATGNLAVKALGPGAHAMTNRELMAHHRYLVRHPGAYRSVFAAAFGEAFISRLGQPILFAPLSDVEVETLRDRFFAASTKHLRDAGIAVELDDTAKSFFRKEYVPIEGGRWLRRVIGSYIGNPLRARIKEKDPRYSGARVDVLWDERTRQLKAVVKKGDKVIAVETLAQVPRTKSDFHPDAVARAEYKTRRHEAGHALIEAYFYGPEAAIEMNAFPGGRGGWMEPNTAVPSRDLYLTSGNLLKEVMVLLGGHLAERRWVRDLDGNVNTANGASSDYARARQTVLDAIVNGSIPDIPPLPLIMNPSTHQVEMSEEMKVRLERAVDWYLEYAFAYGDKILEKNAAVHDQLTALFDRFEDGSVPLESMANVLDGKIVKITAEEVNSLKRAAADRVMEKATMRCDFLLLASDALKPELRQLPWWKRVLHFIMRRK